MRFWRKSALSPTVSVPNESRQTLYVTPIELRPDFHSSGTAGGALPESGIVQAVPSEFLRNPNGSWHPRRPPWNEDAAHCISLEDLYDALVNASRESAPQVLRRSFRSGTERLLNEKTPSKSSAFKWRFSFHFIPGKKPGLPGERPPARGYPHPV